MSLGNSLSGITFSGIGSGIDTDSIVSRLMQVEAIPIKRLQQRQAEITNRQSLYAEFRSRMRSLSTAAGSLNNASAFNPIRASSSDTGVATITTNAGAIAGTYRLEVSKLAQAHKVSSGAQASTTAALGLSGTFSVNGVGVEVTATDTLTTVAQKIYSANAGVTASLINGGEGNAYLTLTAKDTGAGKAIQLSDLGTSSVLSSLGLVGGASGIRSAVTNGAAGFAFSSPTTAVSQMLNVAIVPPNTVQITVNGQTIDINLSTDSLDSIATNLNAAGAGVTASVESVTEGSSTKYRLKIVGDSGTPTFTDSENVLTALGVLQQGYSSELVAAQDAHYSLDGVNLTSATNTVGNVIPGATLTLLKANETTPEKSTLTLSRDESAVQSKVKDFVSAYNGIVDFVAANSKFDKDTFAAGPLLGDPMATQIENAVSSLVFDNVAGLTGNYRNLAALGFDFDSAGKLSYDEATLSTALNADPNAVGKLFRTAGAGSVTELTYISSTDKTVASGAGAYDVVVTQAATKGAYTSAVAQTSANSVTETLTFGGALFGNSDYVFVIESGSALADTVAKINSDSKLKDLVSATIEGGKLKIESKKYGAAGNYTVESSLAAAADNSGIGQSMPGTYSTGLDVAGTINGEAATGVGQYLTGNAGNAKTAGLQIQYTGTGSGLVGSMTVTKGVGTKVTDLMSGFLDTVNGQLTTSENSLQDQLDQLGEDIQTLSSRLTVKEQQLRYRFAKMDEMIATLRSQGDRVSQFVASLSASK
ncbi:MAG: flagellar filament capping protein FliD [Fimbriimonadaceae bacterium]|nr:flagellar filament capping protein FliD [Fimbriimonadaceae bacterium]